MNNNFLYKFPISWTDIYLTKNNSNESFYYRKWQMPRRLLDDFFVFWKKFKFEMYDFGYRVRKIDNIWYLYEEHFEKNKFKNIQNIQEIFEIRSCESKQIDLPIYKIKNRTALYTWQIKAVEKLVSVIKTVGCAIDGSDLGLGKTFTAFGVARELNCKIFIVCPKAVKEQWRRVGLDFFNMSDFIIGIETYESIRRGSKNNPYLHYIKNKNTKLKTYNWKLPKNTLIVWDEAQKLKTKGTLNSKMCIAAYEQKYQMLFCSATLATNPLELFTVGKCIKLFNTTSEYYRWILNRGCEKGAFGGYVFNNSPSCLIELNKEIFTKRGIRLTRDEILDFPESQIFANCYNIDDATTEEIQSLYIEMYNELLEITKLKQKNRGAIKCVKLLRARQEIEMKKVPLLVDMVTNGIENNMSVVVFCNFTNTIKALSKRLNTNCIVNGSLSEKIRQKNIDDFQSDKSRVIIVNISAGGAGLSLHDVTGKHPRLSLICPTFSAVVLKQATGRVWRTGAKSKSIQKIIYIANTVESDVCYKVQTKINNLNLINDGDLIDNKCSILFNMNNCKQALMETDTNI